MGPPCCKPFAKLGLGVYKRVRLPGREYRGREGHAVWLERSSVTALVTALRGLADGHVLSGAELQAATSALLDGQTSPALQAAWLTAWRFRGENADLVTATRAALLHHAEPWPGPKTDVLDTCGTGGDGLETFNVSTAAALVVAAVGIPVVKHGNRGVSGPTGSADLLEALGVPIALTPQAAARCLAETGFTFCFAPAWHPALRTLASLRRELGFRTVFNLVGPLANPARPRWQVVGVGRAEWLDVVAESLRRAERLERAVVVHGVDGSDEISLASETQVRWVVKGQIEAQTWTASDFGLRPVAWDECRAASPAESRQQVEKAWSDADHPAARVVRANAAAALFVRGRAESLAHGAELAGDAIASGRVNELVQRLRSFGV